MKRWLIAYASRIRNTKKIAEAMYEAAVDCCDLARCSVHMDLAPYDIVFVEYWVDRGLPDEVVQNFLRRLRDKKIVLFQTLGVEAYGEHSMTCFSNLGMYLDASCKVAGVFSCQGKIDPALIARLKSLPPENPHAPSEENRKPWEAAGTHSDAEDIRAAKANIRRFVERFGKNPSPRVD